jgi:hypothetical protein
VVTALLLLLLLPDIPTACLMHVAVVLAVVAASALLSFGTPMLVLVIVVGTVDVLALASTYLSYTLCLLRERAHLTLQK